MCQTFVGLIARAAGTKNFEADRTDKGYRRRLSRQLLVSKRKWSLVTPTPLGILPPRNVRLRDAIYPD